MINCPNCLANNSFEKVNEDDYSLYVCEYCNTVIEKVPILKEDIFDEDSPSLKIFTTTLEQPPEYNQKNIETFNLIFIGVFIFCFLLLILYLVYY